MLRQKFRWNWPITLYMKVVFFYCIIYNCFAQYTFTKEPMHAAVTEGETVSIKCGWKPDLLPEHNAKWSLYKEGSFIKYVDENSDTHDILLSERKFSTLLIQSFSGSDAGSYRCEIESYRNAVTSNLAEVSVLTCNPKTDEGEIGSTPECFSTSDIVDLQWFKNGEPLGGNKKSPISTIPLSKEDDGVEFTCRATRDSLQIGNCTTIPLILTVRAWIEKNPPEPIQVSDKFNLTCLVNGDTDKYDYRWMFESKSVNELTRRRYKLGEEKNVLVFSEVISKYHQKNVTCTVIHDNCTIAVAFYIIELTTSTIAPSLYTNQILQSASRTTDSYQNQNTFSTTTIVIGVITVISVIFATILIICLLVMRRKKRNVTKHESVPLKDSSFVAIKKRPTSTESRHVSDKNAEKDPIREQLITDTTVCHEPTALNSQPNAPLNTSEVLYAEPAIPADDSDRQLGSSQVVSYDTPRKTVSLDNLDDSSKQGASLSVENLSDLYAKPNKTLSRESIDAMYAKPNKTPSRESIDELYSKPNKSATNTPKSSHKDPTQINVEGLTYADIEFQNGAFPSPDPKDYGLEYASVQFTS